MIQQVVKPFVFLIPRTLYPYCTCVWSLRPQPDPVAPKCWSDSWLIADILILCCSLADGSDSWLVVCIAGTGTLCARLTRHHQEGPAPDHHRSVWRYWRQAEILPKFTVNLCLIIEQVLGAYYRHGGAVATRGLLLCVQLTGHLPWEEEWKHCRGCFYLDYAGITFRLLRWSALKTSYLLNCNLCSNFKWCLM